MKPNILFIMSDDHAAHALSCYGSYRNSTPNIDRIANEGIRLDNCFCTNSVCTPSRATILTGKYPHVNGAITFNAPDSTHITFPQLLRAAGYYTAVVGKWHLHADPAGFDHWDVLPGQGEYFDPRFVANGVPTTEPGYATDIITDKTIEVLHNRPDDKPFCVLCHHKAPHDPWLSDDLHNRLYTDGDVPEPTSLFDDYAGRSACLGQSTQVIGSKSPGHTLYSEETGDIADPHDRRKAQYQQYIKRYLRCVASIDDNVGRLLDYLDESGLAHNTIVMYTSDQGFFLGEHGWYDKRFMYEESLRMPFVVRYPNEIPAGRSDDRLAINADFAPTILDYAGVDTPDDMQGRSLRPILTNRDVSDWRESMYYRYYKSHFNTPAHWGVRTEKHKYIYYGASNEHELFDLEDDPAEMRNRWDDPDYRAVRDGLVKECDRLRDELEDREDWLDGHIRCQSLFPLRKHPMHG